MKERLQKILSAYGIASRRAAEKMLENGCVTVNGITASVGDGADPDLDTIAVNGEALSKRPERIYLMLNKPRGYVTTLSDEKGRKNVSELVRDAGMRVLPVGRLDIDSEGLLVMTNDGALIQKLTHPSYEVDKTYLAWTLGDAEKALPALNEPMEIDGKRLKKAQVRLIRAENGQALLEFRIHEGKNRQIRKMCRQIGLTVTRLKRISEGGLALGGLPSGGWRFLTGGEISMLRKDRPGKAENAIRE